MELYEELLAAGCQMDNHESDLYILDTPEAREIIARYPVTSSTFRSAVDNKRWLEVPFQYAPWWRQRQP